MGILPSASAKSEQVQPRIFEIVPTYNTDGSSALLFWAILQVCRLASIQLGQVRDTDAVEELPPDVSPTPIHSSWSHDRYS